MTSKADVRMAIRKQLQLANAFREENSRRICEALSREPAWIQASTVALFASLVHEPDVERLWNKGHSKTFCYPRVRDLDLDFLRVDTPAELLPSRWQLREPRFVPERVVPLEEIGVMLVPGIAFTRFGERLGRGGGFYDRLLARPELHAMKIGVCFELQMRDELPTEPHDARVDLVVTECDALVP